MYRYPSTLDLAALFENDFADEGQCADQQYILTINAGSNTVSMFYIKPFDPLHPVLVGRPASTLGQFPMSVAYSSVLSTGESSIALAWPQAPSANTRPRANPI
jgi:hypothetical protein